MPSSVATRAQHHEFVCGVIRVVAVELFDDLPTILALLRTCGTVVAYAEHLLYALISDAEYGRYLGVCHAFAFQLSCVSFLRTVRFWCQPLSFFGSSAIQESRTLRCANFIGYFSVCEPDRSEQFSGEFSGSYEVFVSHS